MKEQLEKISAAALLEISQASSRDELEKSRIKYLGKKRRIDLDIAGHGGT